MIPEKIIDLEVIRMCNEFAAHVKPCMDAIDITQGAMAKKTFLNPCYASGLLKGKKNPTFYTVAQTGYYMGCKVHIVMVPDIHFMGQNELNYPIEIFMPIHNTYFKPILKLY